MQKNSTIIAVVHDVVDLGKFESNLSRIEEVAKRAKDEGAEILFLPAMLNGVPIFDLRRNLRVKVFTETIPGKTSEYLAKIASKFNLYIVAGPILERRGSKVYRSAFVVDPAMNVKSVISQISTPPHLGQSSSTPVATIKDLNIGLFIAEDIHLPELSLLMRLQGVDIVIFYPYPQTAMDKIIAVLRARALELKTTIVCIGYAALRKEEEVMFMPTVVVDENGFVSHEILERGLKMIKMSIWKSRPSSPVILSPGHRKFLKTLSKTLTYYLRPRTS